METNTLGRKTTSNEVVVFGVFIGREILLDACFEHTLNENGKATGKSAQRTLSCTARHKYTHSMKFDTIDKFTVTKIRSDSKRQPDFQASLQSMSSS